MAPQCLSGTTVLDLGCGAGRDIYALAQLVGPKGKAIGVDMTNEQLEVARGVQSKFASTVVSANNDGMTPNTKFVHGYIEDLKSARGNSVDVIVSNCVVNLSPDKTVFTEAYRVLKPGGEMYFSDVYSSRRIPEDLVKDPVLFGECLLGQCIGTIFYDSRKNAA